MIRAALYIRVSTDRQAEEGDSLDAQRATLTAWANANGYIPTVEYVDAGESATVSDRPEFQRMVADAARANRPFDAILVWKWARFARNQDDAAIYKSVFRQQYGVELIAVGEPKAEGPTGRLIEGVLDVVAEFQSAATAADVKNTMSKNAREGRWMGMPPFGYRIGEDGRLVVHDEEAEVVRWMFQAAKSGEMSLSEIARRLAAGNVFPASRRLRWSPQAVRNLLGNPAFIGELRWNRRKSVVVREIQGNTITTRKSVRRRRADEWISVPNAHPAIVDRMTFDQVQTILAQHQVRFSHRAAAGEYLFRGLCICRLCQGTMVHVRPNRGQARLACQRYFRVPRECKPYNYILFDDLTTAVLERADELLRARSTEGFDIVLPAPARTARRLTEADWEARFDRLLQTHINGLIDLETFARQQRRLQEEKKEWEQSLLADQAHEGSLKELQARVANAVNLLRDPNVPVNTKNAALRGVLERIEVDRNEGTLRFVWRAFSVSD